MSSRRIKDVANRLQTTTAAKKNSNKKSTQQRSAQEQHCKHEHTQQTDSLRTLFVATVVRERRGSKSKNNRNPKKKEFQQPATATSGLYTTPEDRP
jgi:hypothetical protein